MSARILRVDSVALGSKQPRVLHVSPDNSDAKARLQRATEQAAALINFTNQTGIPLRVECIK